MVVHKIIIRLYKVNKIKFILLCLHTFFRTKQGETITKDFVNHWLGTGCTNSIFFGFC